MARKRRRLPGLLIALALFAVGGGAVLTANASASTPSGGTSAPAARQMSTTMPASTRTSGDGDMSQVKLAGGTGFSFHYDFFADWDDATQAAMVAHCINGGLQCDAHGYDQSRPGKGAVLDDTYELIP